MSLLVERLKSSPTLRPLGELDKDWFYSSSRPAGALLGDDGQNGAKRKASIALVLREVEGRDGGGRSSVEMLVIKRAVRPR